MSDKHWLVLIGNKRGVFMVQQPNPLASRERTACGRAKPAVSLSLSLSFPPLPRLSHPPLSRTEAQRWLSSDGTVYVFCCFTLHTTQWAKACLTLVSAHFRLVFSFCDSNLSGFFLFLPSQNLSLLISHHHGHLLWSYFHLMSSHTFCLCFFHCFKCDFVEETGQIREGV